MKTGPSVTGCLAAAHVGLASMDKIVNTRVHLVPMVHIVVVSVIVTKMQLVTQ